MKKMSVFDAKTHFSGLIEQVHQRHESVTITRRGMPVAKIVPFDEPHQQNVAHLLHELDVLSIEIGKVDIDLKEIKKMKEEGRR